MAGETHGIIEWLRLEVTFGHHLIQPPAHALPLRRGEHVQKTFAYQAGSLCSFSGKCLTRHNLTIKTEFPDVQAGPPVFWFVLFMSTTERACLCQHYTSLLIFMYVDKILPESSPGHTVPSLPAFPHIRDVLNPLCGPLFYSPH